MQAKLWGFYWGQPPKKHHEAVLAGAGRATKCAEGDELISRLR